MCVEVKKVRFAYKEESRGRGSNLAKRTKRIYVCFIDCKTGLP